MSILFLRNIIRYIFIYILAADKKVSRNHARIELNAANIPVIYIINNPIIYMIVSVLVDIISIIDF